MNQSTDNRNKMKRRIAPGFWEDMDGALHISIPELCEVAGLEYTEKNRQKVVDMIKEMRITKETLYRSSPDDPGTKI